MRKIIHTAIILMSLLLSNHLVAQDTIHIKYNTQKQELTITTKSPVTSFGFYIKDTINNPSALAICKKDNIRYGNIDPRPSFFCSNGDSMVVYCPQCKESDIRKMKFYNQETAEKLSSESLILDYIIIPIKSITTDNYTIKRTNSHSIEIILIFVLIILLGGSIVFFNSRRKKKEKKTTLSKTEEKNPMPGLKIIRLQDHNRVVGLNHVKGCSEEYYLLDMQKQYDDTVIYKIYLHHTVIKKTYDFFKTFLESANRTPETGCYFIGCWEYADESHKTYNISLEDIVEPGDDIEPDEYSFNFGYKIGGYLDIKIRNLREKTGRDYVHTVWMHSHPGIGLFLSSQDMVVQDLLTNKKEAGRLAAFVIDTNSSKWDFAVFTTKMNGEMNNQSDMKYTYSLDELYGWSRKIHFQNDNKDFDNYYKIELNDKGGNGFAKLYLSGKVINQLDGIMYDSKDGVVAGSLSGCTNSQDNWCCIEELTKTSDTSLGTIIVDSELSYEMLFTKYEESIRESLVVIICRTGEELWICSRKDTNCQFVEKEKITSCTTGQLREWIRRKRV